ncbi:DUF551 domain-containing protein, partial [Raoultella ornithinolytica]
GAKNVVCFDSGNAYADPLREVTPLYRHAQPAPVVPEEKPMPNPLSMYAIDAVAAISEAKGWKACRAAMLQAGISAVIPDGYVMVPKEPTEAMMLHKSGCQHHAWDDPDCAMRQTRRLIWSHMLAAAPQLPGSEPATVPDRWIPVSERMPDDDDFVYIWPRPDFGVELHVGQYCECSPKGDGWYAQVYEQNYGIEWYPITVTHWMPLPADPQEVNHG